MINDKNCIFCGRHIQYWPNYSPNTSSDYGNVAWVITKRNREKRQFFHISCFKTHCKKEGDIKCL